MRAHITILQLVDLCRDDGLNVVNPPPPPEIQSTMVHSTYLPSA